MKIWILKPKEGLSKNDNPWQPWYDRAFGFIVEAETAVEARGFAHNEAGDENRGEFLGNQTAKTKEPWKNPKYSTCVELVTGCKSGVIMRAFAGA